MTLGDLYPDVRLYSEVETINMTGGGGGGGNGGGTYGGRGGRWEDIWKGWRGWQGDDPFCCLSVGVSSDFMRNFELYGGLFLDWEG